MFSVCDSRSSSLGSSPDRGHTSSALFLGKTLYLIYSHSASLHPGVQMGSGVSAGDNPAMDWDPI